MILTPLAAHPPTRRRRRRRAAILSLPVALLVAAIPPGAAAQPPDLWPTDGWKTSLPEAHGLDGAALQRLARLIREGERFPDLHGLLVVRDGALVVEEYFAGHDADRLHMLQSVTKSFTSAAIGIAIGRGAIAGVREPVLGFFPGREGIAHLDARKRAMTLGDLLTMRSGTDYHERGPDSPHHRLNALPAGWTDFVLGRPMVADPGTVFQYDSGGVILMSAMLEARTGAHVDAYLAEHLFAPLGIERVFWIRNAEGHPHAGGGLWLRPRDMAKFGLLILRGGRWENAQVVPAAWVAAATRRHVTFPASGGNTTGYGYLWWIMRPDPAGDGQTPIYAACGAHGQYIFVVPEHDMVVVVTGGTRNEIDRDRPREFLYTHILPAVMR